MLAALLGAVRSDIGRQTDWVREEIRRQIRYAALIGVLSGTVVLCALGALIVGLIAAHAWLAPQIGSLAALGVIGAGLLLLMLILLAVAFSLRRPGLKTRPALQVQPAALLRTPANGDAGQAIAAGMNTFHVATETLRKGTRSEMLGVLALIAVAGVITGRRLRPLGE
jgi:hypothetical protein